jgi:hypothetical protein
LTDAGELISLTEAGVASLGVNYTNQSVLDAQGNILGEKSLATSVDGNSIEMVDVYFKTVNPNG